MRTFKCLRQFMVFIFVLIWLTPIGESRGRSGGGIGVGKGGGRNFSGKSGGTAKKVGTGALVGGLGTYAAYRSWDRDRDNNKSPSSSESSEAESGLAYSENFIVLRSTYLQRREGSGMSAWTLLMIILGIIGGCTLLWYCYAIGVPLWRDRQASRRRSYQLTNVNVKGSGDDMPLHETPSTATPSP